MDKQDVLYALLALDSYNRHRDNDNRKMSEKDRNELSSQIGTATFQESSDRFENDEEATLLGSQTAGFSASHYKIDTTKPGDEESSFQDLISYRGTDFNTGTPEGLLELLTDVVQGRLTSFNALDPETFEPLNAKLQPYYAQKFYELISGNKIFPTLAEGEQTNEIILTGHSLGGSLAGYVGSLTNDQTTIFNEIPYIGMALRTAINTFIDQNVENGVEAIIQALEQVLQGEVADVPGFSFTPFVIPDADSITSFRMTGELAAGARALGPLLGTAVSLYVQSYTKKIEDLADATPALKCPWEMCPLVREGISRGWGAICTQQLRHFSDIKEV